MSLKYFRKLYKVAQKKGIFYAFIFDAKTTGYLLDARLCNLIDFIEDYLTTRKFNSDKRTIIKNRLKDRRIENMRKNLEVILENN